MSKEYDDITLADIENMVRILEKFVRTYKRAERVMQRMAPRGYRGRFDPMALAYEMVMRQRAEEEGVPVTEEDLEESLRLTDSERKTLEKIRRGKAKEVK